MHYEIHICIYMIDIPGGRGERERERVKQCPGFKLFIFNIAHLGFVKSCPVCCNAYCWGGGGGGAVTAGQVTGKYILFSAIFA